MKRRTAASEPTGEVDEKISADRGIEAELSAGPERNDRRVGRVVVRTGIEVRGLWSRGITRKDGDETVSLGAGRCHRKGDTGCLICEFAMQIDHGGAAGIDSP